MGWKEVQKYTEEAFVKDTISDSPDEYTESSFEEVEVNPYMEEYEEFGEATWKDRIKATLGEIAFNPLTAPIETFRQFARDDQRTLHHILDIYTGGLTFIPGLIARNFLIDNKELQKKLDFQKAQLDRTGEFNKGWARAMTYNMIDFDKGEDSVLQTVGETLGILARDVVGSFALGGGALGLAGSMAVNNTVSEYVKQNGMGKTDQKALEAAVAHGVGTAVSGVLFLKLFPGAADKVIKSVGKNFLTTGVKSGVELAGWEYGANYVERSILNNLDGHGYKNQMMGFGEAGLNFGVGMAFDSVFRTPGLFLRLSKKLGGAALKKVTPKFMKNFASNRVKKNLNERFVDDIVDDTIRKTTEKENAINDILSKNPREFVSGNGKVYKKRSRELDSNTFEYLQKKIEDDIFKGKDKQQAIEEALKELGDEYISAENISKLWRKT